MVELAPELGNGESAREGQRAPLKMKKEKSSEKKSQLSKKKRKKPSLPKKKKASIAKRVAVGPSLLLSSRSPSPHGVRSQADKAQPGGQSVSGRREHKRKEKRREFHFAVVVVKL